MTLLKGCHILKLLSIFSNPCEAATGNTCGNTFSKQFHFLEKHKSIKANSQTNQVMSVEQRNAIIE